MSSKIECFKRICYIRVLKTFFFLQWPALDLWALWKLARSVWFSYSLIFLFLTSNVHGHFRNMVLSLPSGGHQCGGLNENGLCKLIYLNTSSQFGRTVWEVLEGRALLEMCLWRQTLRFQKLTSFQMWLSVWLLPMDYQPFHHSVIMDSISLKP